MFRACFPIVWYVGLMLICTQRSKNKWLLFLHYARTMPVPPGLLHVLIMSNITIVYINYCVCSCNRPCSLL